MSQGFFQRNQKLMMTVLLVIIAPSFAFTGLMTSVMQSSLSGSAYRVFGDTLTFQELFRHKQELRNMMVALRAREGLVGRVSARDEDALRYYMQKIEADRLGIALSDEELSEYIREAAKDLICGAETRVRIQQSGQQIPEGLFGAYYNAFYQQARPTTRFTKAAYMDALEGLRIGMNVKEFEDNIALALRLQKLQSAISGSVVVSEREAYEQFDEQQHERVLRFVRVPAESFAEAAGEKVTDEDLARVYEANKPLFALPNRLSIDALKVNFPQLSLSHQPTADEVKARYDEDKASLYLAKTEFDPENPGSEEDEYKPLEEVQAQVITSIRNEWALAKQKELLDGALAEVERRRTEDPEATFANLRELVAQEFRDYVDVIRSPIFSTQDVADLPENILNTPKLRSLLIRFSTLNAGDFGEEVIELADGHYVYRVAELFKADTPKLEDCRDEVMEKAVEEKSAELAMEVLQEWYDAITAEESTVTLAAKAQEGNYTITTCDAAGRNESDKIAIDGKRLNSAFNILRAGFEIEEPGGISVPILANDSKEAYIVEYGERVPANSAKFADMRDSIRSQVQGRLAIEAWESYMADLEKQADIQRLFELEDEEEGEGEGEGTEGDAEEETASS